jgi:hypothetical protein
MADTNTTSVAGVVKRVYGKLTEQQNLEHKAIDQIGNSSAKMNPGGAGFYGAINDYGNESVGAINETEQFRTIDSEDYKQFTVLPKINVAPIQFSGLVAAATDGDEEAFVAAVVDGLEKAKQRLLKDENRQFFGLGNGLLANVGGNVASNVTSFSVDSAQYLRANMVIDIFNGATKTCDSKRITDVDKVNNIVYLGSVTLGAALITTDQLVKENIRDSAPSDGKEMMGLRGIVDDSTDLTTFESLDALNNRIWRGRRIDASSANLTSDLLQRLLDDTKILGGSEPDMLIMHHKQKRKYLDIVVPQKRYNDQNMDAGAGKLSFNGIDLFLDADCQQNTVYALTKKYLQKYELKPIHMGNHDGSDVYLRQANFDLFQAYWRHYSNFGTDKRNAHGKIVNLGSPSGVS